MHQVHELSHVSNHVGPSLIHELAEQRVGTLVVHYK